MVTRTSPPQEPADKLEAGADNQTWAICLAALMLSILAGVGLEFQVLLLHDWFWIPPLLVAAYLFLALIFWVSIGIVRQSSVKLLFNGRKEKVKLRPANSKSLERVKRIADEMGIKKLTVLAIPRTNECMDAYSEGDFENSHIVLTGGMELLASRTDPKLRERFDFIIRHEAAHLLRSDPLAFSVINASIRASLTALGLKILLMLILGLSTLGDWYRPFFPRSFAVILPTGYLVESSLSAFKICLWVIGINLVLIFMLLLLYWIWVRKREYWADHIAIRTFSDTQAAVKILEELLSTTRLRNFLPHAARGNGIWHPSTKRRIAAAASKIPMSGFYSFSGAILVVVMIFLFRYVFGNNSGTGLLDFPDNLLTFGLSLFYFIFSFILVYLLLFPLGRASALHVALRYHFRFFMSVGCIIVMVTTAAMAFDFLWTNYTTRITANYTRMILQEILEREVMLFGLGFSLIVFAITAFLQRIIFPRFWSLTGLVVSFLLLMFFSRFGGNLIANSRSEVVSNVPYQSGPAMAEAFTKEGEGQCLGKERLFEGLAKGIVRLSGGRADLQFSPPLGVFDLTSGPTSVATWNDERSSNVPLILRNKMKLIYAEAQAKDPNINLDEFYKLILIKEFMGRFNRAEATEFLGNLIEKKPLSDKQQENLNKGLEKCVGESNAQCVRLALALGADARYTHVEGTAEYGLLNSLVKGRLAYAGAGLAAGSLSYCERTTLKLLVKAGLDPNEGILRYVVEGNDLESIKLLLQNKADPNIVWEADPTTEAIEDARTPLSAAVQKGNQGLVQILLAAGANVNFAAQYGITPLMMTANRCDAPVVAILLKAGADSQLKDWKGQRAADYAVPPNYDRKTFRAMFRDKKYGRMDQCRQIIHQLK